MNNSCFKDCIVIFIIQIHLLKHFAKFPFILKQLTKDFS